MLNVLASNTGAPTALLVLLILVAIVVGFVWLLTRVVLGTKRRYDQRHAPTNSTPDPFSH